MRKSEPEERDLREHFADLRAEVSASAPPFRTLAEPQKPRRVPRWIPVTVGFASAAAATVLLTVSTISNPIPELDPAFATVAWRGPTDYLLSTPGNGVLGTIPEIDYGLSLPAPVEPSTTPDDTLR